VLKSRLSLLLAVAVLPLAGCGDSGSSSPSGADPAKVVPAAAPVYVEAVVRPDGDVGDGAKDALKKLLHTDDPGQKIVALFDKAAAKDDVTWDEVKQWLGPRIGFYFTDIDGDNLVGAIVADVTDKDKAKATLAKIEAKTTHHDTVRTIVGDYAVFGSAAGVRAVQATADGGKPLADVPDYKAARDAVAADDGLGVAYVEPQQLVDVLARAKSTSGDSPLSDPDTVSVVRQLATKAGRTAALTLHADGDAVRVDGAAIGAPAGASPTAAADALAALPADAWFAVGFGDLGSALSNGLAQLSQISSLADRSGRAPDFSAILARFEKRTGIDVQRDFLSWMGDGGVYVRGHGIADIGGVLTIKSKDGARSRKAVGILAQGLARAGMNVRDAKVPGYDVAVELRSASAPISFFIAANADRFSLGVNPKAMSDLLDPAKKLGDSDTYEKATDSLGGDVKPIFILDTPTIIGLFESFGAGQAPGYAKAKPYLDALGPITAGAARDGDVARFSFALGLR